MVGEGHQGGSGLKDLGVRVNSKVQYESTVAGGNQKISHILY